MKYSQAQAAAIIAAYVDSNKIAVDSFTATKNNTVGLLDKVGAIINLKTNIVDKLEMFNGMDLEFGKTVEEWASDLILPEDYDATGANALAPHDSTYRPVSYSFTLGRKKIPQTIRNNDIERAVNNVAQLSEIVADKYQRITDSTTAFRYGLKREALATLIGRCVYNMTASNATAWTDVDHSTVNALFKEDALATETYILVKPYESGDASDFDDAIAKGYLIKNELVTEIAVPTDTETGEAFIKQVKDDVEVASDMSEGHSLNGNTLGSSENLVLLIKQGIMSSLQVDTLAGAFNKDELALGVETVVVKDFGSDENDAYAILMDRRGMRLYNSYRAVRENLNGDGDFLNLFAHSEDTVHVSKNTFVKVYTKD